MPANPKTIADRYISLWNESDPARRRAIMAEAWTPAGRYVDPLMSGEGREGVAAMIEAARAQFPGHSFALRGEPDGYGNHVRFSWSLAPDAGPPVAFGTDVAVLDADERIESVIGFLDQGAADA